MPALRLADVKKLCLSRAATLCNLDGRVSRFRQPPSLRSDAQRPSCISEEQWTHAACNRVFFEETGQDQAPGGDKARDARRTPSTAYNASDKLDTDFIALSALWSLIVLVIHLAAGILIPHRRSYPEYDYCLNARVCSPAKAFVTVERGMETTIGTDASGGSARS